MDDWTWVLTAVPLTYASAAVLLARAGLGRVTAAAAFALGLAVLSAAALALDGPMISSGRYHSVLGTVRLDALTCVMLLLVAFIGLVITQFSRAYLAGDLGRARYARWLMATLASVSLLVITNNLVVLALAWTATSLSLHQLLTFFRDRPQALLAAHKKFLVSRLGDGCILSAVAILGTTLRTVEIDQVFVRLGSYAEYPAALGGAAALIAVGALLRSAQLPFHGWLIQVMEAPTSVSALLHAGVVNIGGFVLIRLAPLMAKADAAQAILVTAGSFTAVIAALVMTTRVSAKVNLAWSTCAQMGFMLVQCGLGAYELAVLHLVAHSLYKAYAFLRAGSVVAEWKAQALRATPGRVGLHGWLASAAVSLASVGLVAFVLRVSPRAEPALVALVPVMGLALTTLLVNGVVLRGSRGASLVAGSVLLTALYFAWHALFRRLLPHPIASELLVSSPRLAIVLGAFGTLFGVHAMLEAIPNARVAQRIHRHLYAGLYLDELFTRLTFRVWPPGLLIGAKPASLDFQGTEARS